MFSDSSQYSWWESLDVKNNNDDNINYSCIPNSVQATLPCRTERQAGRHTHARRRAPLKFTTRKPLGAMKVNSYNSVCLLQTPEALQGWPVHLHSGRVSHQGLLHSSQSALGASMKRSQHSRTWAISFPWAIGRGLPHDREKLHASSLWGGLLSK